MIHRHVEQPRPKQTCKVGKQHAKSADPYPWLDSKDPRRNMTDEEILWKYIDLTDSTLDEEGKAELMEIILKYKKAFSLRDEIGECPNIKVDIDVIDDTPFFVRPFPISEEDKPCWDWQCTPSNVLSCFSPLGNLLCHSLHISCLLSSTFGV